MEQDDLDPQSPLARRSALMMRFQPFDLRQLPGSWVVVAAREGGPLRLGDNIMIGVLFPILFEDPSEDPTLPDMVEIGNILMPQGWIHDINAEGGTHPGWIPVVHRDGKRGILLYEPKVAEQPPAEV